MKHYKMIIFDWDGTLMDSIGKIIKCMQHMATTCKLPIPNDEDVKSIIGISLRPAIAQLFDIKDIPKNSDRLNQLVATYKQRFIDIDQTSCALFEGVDALLKDLTQTRTCLAVATGKARRGLDRAWKNTATADYFVDSCCADEAESKPSPQMLNLILHRNQLESHEVLMVGDSVYDLEMASHAGIDSVAVSYGASSSEKLQACRPLELFDTVDSMSCWLKQRVIID